MKHLYVTILFSLFTVISIHGQETIKHIVQRGETLESIAKDYNLSQTELQNANYDMEIFYTGLENGWMDDQLGQGANRYKCTLCGGSGKCKYCQ